MSFDNLVAKNGWDNYSQLTILNEFITKYNLDLDDMASDVASEENGEDTTGSFEDLIVEQGWNEVSQISIMMEFVKEKDLTNKLYSFAKNYD